MEARVRSFAVLDRLMLVLQVVLDVTQLVVNDEEFAHVDPGTLLDTDVVRGEEVPRTGVTNQVASVFRLLQDALVPEVPESKGYLGWCRS